MERDKVLDTTKYILISLVIIGHFIEPTKYTDTITQHLYCLIYSFHMPLFIWISGYFHKQRSIGEELKKCIPILEACLLCHIGFLILRYRSGFSIIKLFDFGVSPSWYILSYVYWKITTEILSKWFSAPKLLVFSILVDAIAFLFIAHGGYMSVGRTILFYPFFVLGYAMNGNLTNILSQKKRTIIVLGLASVGFVLCTTSVLQFKVEFHNSNLFTLLQFTDFPPYVVFIYRYILSICAILIGSLLLVMINSNTILQQLSQYGKNTLFIYYAQTPMFAIIGVMDISLWQSLLIAFVTIPILTYISNRHIAKWLMNPITSLYKKHKHSIVATVFI